MKANFETKFFITCDLVDGTNYFCGLVKHPIAANIDLIEWDTDINYAKQFDTHREARIAWNKIKVKKDETWKIQKIKITITNPKLN